MIARSDNFEQVRRNRANMPKIIAIPDRVIAVGYKRIVRHAILFLVITFHNNHIFFFIFSKLFVISLKHFSYLSCVCCIVQIDQLHPFYLGRISIAGSFFSSLLLTYLYLYNFPLPKQCDNKSIFLFIFGDNKSIEFLSLSKKD